MFQIMHRHLPLYNNICKKIAAQIVVGQSFRRLQSPSSWCGVTQFATDGRGDYDPHFKCHLLTKSKCYVKFLMAFHTIVGGARFTVDQCIHILYCLYEMRKLMINTA